MSPAAQRAEDLVRAERLRVAADLIEQFAPINDHRERRDRTDILRRLGLLIAGLERAEDRAICRRCQVTFAFSPSWFAQRGLSAPRHCDDCRSRRRRERAQAHVSGAASVPPADEH
jgi:hypothetical protein